MLDFLIVSTRSPKKDVVEIYPKFKIIKSKDLMIRGSDFYAIWDDDRKLWSTDEQDALYLIDRELQEYAKENASKYEGHVKVLYMWDSDTGMIDKWHKYCKQQCRDNYHMLDETLIFSNHECVKEDYASKMLNYPLAKGDIAAYDELMSVLYSPEERHKIEWAIGSIVEGSSKSIQKFLVLYGAAGTGKSTILNIIQMLFEGYYSVFDAKALGSSSNAFALEAFKTNPLIAIQHDGDLSRIEDNTRLNSLVSHEWMTVNEKFRSTYTNKFKAFLFMGTNKPVKITDGRSGLIRRLIDVTPTGDKVSVKKYNTLMEEIKFELGAIAYYCKEIFLENPNYYDTYIPIAMMGASNDFYNFMLEYYYIFKERDSITLTEAWDLYQQYCIDAKVPNPHQRRVVREELKNYFRNYEERSKIMNDGKRIRSLYSGFRLEKFEGDIKSYSKPDAIKLIEFNSTESIFDKEASEYPAQYANGNGTPLMAWDNVKTKLSELDTSKLHYVKVPENHIVIDFDIPDENGNKCYEKNLAAASKWPSTYAELSKSGAGIHLHYIWDGDVTKLNRLYAEHIEVKVFSGKSSLRRMLTKCNDIPIKTINTGLPLKEKENKMVSKESIQSEKGLRRMVIRVVNKEFGATKPSIDFLKKILDDAYESELSYNIRDMYALIQDFASNSTNNAEYCMELVEDMHFESSDRKADEYISNDEKPICFFDTEVFEDVFVLCYKSLGSKKVIPLINPTAEEVSSLFEDFRMVGFNNRNYDNHICYARMLNYSNEQLYDISKRIIAGDKTAKFGKAYNLSYTDIFDFSSEKKGLKKFEIELGIHHQELGLSWDKPAGEENWNKVAEYCINDVEATEAVWKARSGDFDARQILVDLTKLLHGFTNTSVNDSTNSLSEKIIFGQDKNPQRCFNWRNLALPIGSDRYLEYRERFGSGYKFRVFNADGLPEYREYIPGEELPEGWSILPFFPGYEYKNGVSTYLDEIIGEGGKVYSVPGMYVGVWDGDITSQHPHSAYMEMIFGPLYTNRMYELVEARVAIKHKDFEKASTLLNGALVPYLDEEKAPALAQALKIVINSIYGLTKARFKNAFRDDNNIDNIVAKRGALFMTLLKQEVEKQGYMVAHIKTDSIKIPNADEHIKNFVIRFGKEYGYSFETEAEFSKFCLLDKATYVARNEKNKWIGVGPVMKDAYTFKTLFSHEDILFDDLCETRETKQDGLYLDFNENLPSVKEYEDLRTAMLLILSGVELSKKQQKLLDLHEDMELEDIEAKIAEGHNYQFIGRVGRFCPVKPGCGGGELLMKNGEKYSAAQDSKGYLWKEAEIVRSLNKESDIDISYYDKRVNALYENISEYGDFEWFVSDDDSVPFIPN